MYLLLYRGERFDPNFFYHSGLDIDHAFLLARKKKVLFVPKLNESLARREFRGEVVVYKNPIKELSRYIKGKDVLADFSSLNARLAAHLSKVCKLKDGSKELLQARAKKRNKEVSDIRRAAGLTKEVLASLDLRKAKTELDVERQIKVAAAERGIELAFEPTVASGTSTAYPHYRARKKRLGQIVLVDCGLRHNHYCSDITRCFILDRDKKKHEEYEKLQNICHSIVDELPALGTGKRVVEFSAKLMERAGFPKMIHAIGHGVGLDVHEFPILNPKSKDSLVGSVLAIEPAFYLKRYGMRFEETVHFSGKKARIL